MLQQRCERIRVLVLDVDGVLTAGGIVLGNADEELKQFHVRDGFGLSRWHAVGKVSAIITGRQAPLVVRRAGELSIVHIYQNARDKLPALEDLFTRIKATPEETAYIGDDVPDVPCLERVGLAIAPADGCPEVRRLAHYVTRAGGGQGAVREAIERILRCQGRW